jgi:type I restriction enzyme S subunit
MSYKYNTYRLDEVCEFQNGFAFKNSDYVANDIGAVEVFRMGYIERGGGFKEDNTPVFVPKNYKKNMDRYSLEKGDLCIAMTDMKNNMALLANTARVPVSGRFWLNQRVGRIRVVREDILDPLYLYYYSNSKPHIEYLRSRANSGVQVNLTTAAIKEAVLNLPSLDTQKKVAKILGELDEKIAVNTQTNQTLEQIAQAIFKSWFVDFDPVKVKMETLASGGSADGAELAAMRVISAKTLDELNSLKANNPEAFNKLAQTAALFPAAMQDSELGDIPEGWSYCTFGDISACFDSKRVPLSKRKREEKQPGTIPYYGATSVMDYVNEWIFDDTYLLLGEDGSVVKDDGTPFVQYIWGKSWVNNHAHVLQGNNGVSTEHLMVFIKGTNIASYVTGAVQLKLNQKNMNSIPFLKASTEINLVFQGVLNGLYYAYKNNIESSQSLSSLRDSLLPRLLSGEMELKDKE